MEPQEFSFYQTASSQEEVPSPKPIPMPAATSNDAGRGNSSGDPASNSVTTNSAATKVDKPKTKTRNKVPFEKGFSQMDWLKLTQTHPDLAGLGGRSNRRLISMDEVKKHKQPDDAWTVLQGRVYNITPYLKFHPGGQDMLMKAAGRDCTSLFNKYHAWVNFDFLLDRCLLGGLETS